MPLSKKIKIGFMISLIIIIPFLFFIPTILLNTRFGDGVITANLCEIDSVQRVSKFRSCSGHAYPNDAISSGKHYFRLHDELLHDGVLNVKLYSIWDGTIEVIQKDEGDIQIGYQIHISSKQYIAVYMHVEPLENISVGMRVKAGDWIGYADVPHPPQNITSFDLCIHYGRAYQEPVLSYFDEELMPDQIFNQWNSRGITSREMMWFEESYRKSNPCCDTCWNNNPEDWIILI